MIADIYTLRYHDSNDIFYVGVSINIKSRLSQHHNQSQNACILEVLEEVEFTNRKELNNYENFWIEQLRQWGFNLKNRNGNKSFKREDAQTKQVHLKEMPDDILKIIRREQLKIELSEEIKLSKEEVLYRILNEWYQYKSKKDTHKKQFIH